MKRAAFMVPILLCIAACASPDKESAPRIARGAPPPPGPAPTTVPPLPGYCKVHGNTIVCDNEIAVAWESEKNFTVSVKYEPFKIPSPYNLATYLPGVANPKLKVRWELPPRDPTAGNFRFFDSRGDGVFLKKENGEFDEGGSDDADDGGKKRYRWTLVKRLDYFLEYPYSIIFHRKHRGSFTHRIDCDPKMVDLPEAGLVTLTFSPASCTATAVP